HGLPAHLHPALKDGEDEAAQQDEHRVGQRHHQRGDRLVDVAGGKVAGDDEDHAGHRQQGIGVEALGARLDDQQDAGKADGHRAPAPPADGRLEQQGGGGGDRQRRRHVDRHDVADRHVEQGEQVEEGGGNVEGAAGQHGAVGGAAQLADLAAEPDQRQDQQQRHAVTHHDELAQRRAFARQLDHRVVDDKGGHADDHGGDAASGAGTEQ